VEAFAIAFATEYLTVDGNSADRTRRITPYASPQLVSNLGVAASHSRVQRVASATAAGAAATAAGYTVTVAARLLVRPSGSDRWLWLAVPVVSRRGALAIADLPSVVPAPDRLALPPPDTSSGDFGLGDQARPVLQRFFYLYLGGGDPAELSYLTAPGTRLEQPELFAQSVSLTDVTANRVPGEVDANAHLLATDQAGFVWPLAYDVRLKDQAGRLEVAGVFPASSSTAPGR